MKIFHKNIPTGSDPILHGIDKSVSMNPFSVPDGYFDKLSSDILSKTAKTTPKNSFNLNPLQVAAVIITAAAIVTAVYFISTSNRSESTTNSIVENTQPDNLVYPEVILGHSKSEPVVYVPASENNMSPCVIINPDASTDDVIKLISLLPLHPQIISYIKDDYSKKHQLHVVEDVAVNNSDINQENQITADFTINTPNNHSPVIFSNNNPVVYPVHSTYVTYQDSNNSATDDNEDNSQINYFALLPKDTCSETAFELNAFVPGNNHYLWSNGDTTAEIYIEDSGLYKIAVTLEDGTVLNRGLQVRIIPKPVLSSNYLVTGCTGASLMLSVEQKNTGYAYSWPQFNLNAPKVTVGNPGLYIANIKGCKMYADSFMVIFTHCDLNIPNVITPNGDGINETFSIVNLEYYPNTELYIYNRNNQLVFQSKNYQNDWDASQAPEGSYFYLLRFPDGITQEGLLTVKRQ